MSARVVNIWDYDHRIRPHNPMCDKTWSATVIVLPVLHVERPPKAPRRSRETVAKSPEAV